METFMPDISQEFEIQQPSVAVWEFLQNIPEVVTCIPGFVLTGQESATKYQGNVKIRLGPIVGSFEGEAEIVEIDSKLMTTKIEGQGLDRKGGSRASATVIYTVEDIDNGSLVKISAEMKLTGALAQMGRTGIVQDVAGQITADFAKNLNSKISTLTPENSIEKGVSSNVKAEEATPIQNISGNEISIIKILGRLVIRVIQRLFGVSK